MADHLHRRPAAVLGDNLRPFRHARLKQKTNQMLAVWTNGIDACKRAAADEILLCADNPIHAKVPRRGRSIGIVTDRDIAFFSAQHM